MEARDVRDIKLSKLWLKANHLLPTRRMIRTKKSEKTEPVVLSPYIPAFCPTPAKNVMLIMDQLSRFRSGNGIPRSWHKGYAECVCPTHINRYTVARGKLKQG